MLAKSHTFPSSRDPSEHSPYDSVSPILDRSCTAGTPAEAPSPPLPAPWAAASRAAVETAARAHLAPQSVSRRAGSATQLLLSHGSSFPEKEMKTSSKPDVSSMKPICQSHRHGLTGLLPAQGIQPRHGEAHVASPRGSTHPRGHEAGAGDATGWPGQLCPPRALCLGLCYLLSQQRQQLPGKEPADSPAQPQMSPYSFHTHSLER